jgi:hypothetical protein
VNESQSRSPHTFGSSVGCSYPVVCPVRGSADRHKADVLRRSFSQQSTGLLRTAPRISHDCVVVVGQALHYVEDENAARGVIWLAGTHGYLRDRPLAIV